MKYITRELEQELEKYIDKKEIIALLGIRQSGKTTLLKIISDRLESKHNKVKFLTFDDVEILKLFLLDIKSFIRLFVEPYQYLFIDEIQYAKESGKQLKYIYDTCQIKIFISGSSVTDISIQSIKYLAGRIFIFNLYPFSFKEFLFAKNKELASIYESKSYEPVILDQLNKYLIEYLIFGGFPRVVLSEDENEKITVLQNLFNILLLRDIKDLFHLADEFKISDILKLLALQAGNIINNNELSQASGLTVFELKKYLNILEKTYILKRLMPFYSNKRTELVKSPKIYFLDPGLKNICIKNFTTSGITGESFEQFIFCEFIKKNLPIKYWRTKSKAEIDFIIDKEYPVPIEVKTKIKQPKLTRSFYSFLSQYKPEKAYLFSLNYEDKIKHENTSIYFLPFVKINTLF